MLDQEKWYRLEATKKMEALKLLEQDYSLSNYKLFSSISPDLINKMKEMISLVDNQHFEEKPTSISHP